MVVAGGVLTAIPPSTPHTSRLAIVPADCVLTAKPLSEISLFAHYFLSYVLPASLPTSF